MRVLHCEDEQVTADAVAMALQVDGAHCYTTGSGEEAIELARLYDYDALLLDLTLPDVDGYEVLRRIRDHKIGLPVIVVTSQDHMQGKLKAFELGADDYIAKPFHKDELLARLRAVVRRWNGHAVPVIAVGDLEIDTSLTQVRAAGKAVHLTGKEYAMLELLALRQGVTITKEMFLNHLYGGMDEPDVKIVDVFICKLRRKLAEAGAEGLIQTVWGRGYTLREVEG